MNGVKGVRLVFQLKHVLEEQFDKDYNLHSISTRHHRKTPNDIIWSFMFKRRDIFSFREGREKFLVFINMNSPN